MLKYGIIGLGNLGEKIARNLIKKGFSVKIFDKDQKNINKLVKLGAINSKSISEVANEVDGLITCLPSPKISTEVMAGLDGAIHYLKNGSTWIETSTTDINELKKVSIKWYRIGHLPFKGDEVLPSDKYLNIGIFKKGFATKILPKYIFKHKLLEL